MIGMAYPAITQKGRQWQSRRVLRDIFNLYLPCFDWLVFSPLNPVTIVHRHTDSAGRITISFDCNHSYHFTVVVMCHAQGQVIPTNRTVKVRNRSIYHYPHTLSRLTSTATMHRLWFTCQTFIFISQWENSLRVCKAVSTTKVELCLAF